MPTIPYLSGTNPGDRKIIMLKQTTFGEVTRFDLARRLPGSWSYWTTAYWVDGMMVDTGCAHTRKELLKALEGRPVERIVNTHTHEDHIGANGALQWQNPKLDILAHPLALPVLADPAHEQPLHPYRRLFWGWPEPSHGDALRDGDLAASEQHTFQAIYTPGHSPDHLCLYEPEQGWLFSGDLYVGGLDRALRAGYDIWGIIDSLKRVQALPVRWLFPGSARVRQFPAGDLQAKIDYLEEQGENVLALHQRGWGVGVIARVLFGKPMPVEFITLGHFSRRHLVLSYLRQNQES